MMKDRLAYIAVEILNLIGNALFSLLIWMGNGIWNFAKLVGGILLSITLALAKGLAIWMGVSALFALGLYGFFAKTLEGSNYTNDTSYSGLFALCMFLTLGPLIKNSK